MNLLLKLYIEEENTMTNCYFCSSEMIWGGDFMREDYGLEGEGLVVNLSCSNCGAYAEFTQEEQ